MSPRSTSLSEDGEIISEDEEKAINTSIHNKGNGVVNRSTRLPSGTSSRASQLDGTADYASDRSRSRSPYLSDRQRPTSPNQAGRPRSRSPYRASRQRSRSPYRASKVRHGDKRPHDDDHYSPRTGSDPRRFKVHYEDESARRNISSIQSRQSAVERSQAPRTHLYYDDHNSRRGNLSKSDRSNGDSDIRERERSRSPFRPTQRKRSDRDPDLHTSDSNKEAGRHAQNGAGGRVHFTADNREKESLDGLRSETNDHGQDDARQATRGSEADLIEQRRKRREAIKAKYKGQQPLLVQALEHTAISVPGTPAHESSGSVSEQASPPSSIASPRSPQYASTPGSPAELSVTNDEELVDRRHADESSADDGPSAADYDPNMDMQEHRQKIDHTTSAITLIAPGVVPIPDSSSQAEVLPDDDKEMDMFADDDDMFADDHSAPKAAVASTREARALDQSLLDNWDYPDGHYRIIIGELLDGRYAVQQQIGKGTFATVVRAQDTKTGNSVAIKIAANNETMYKAGTKEMEMLAVLNQSDPEDKKHIIQMLRNFDHKGHMCLVFESLSADLREVLKKFGRNVGLNLKAIRSYAQQMFLALGHLKKNEILHADLKPDNILVSDKRNLLKLCDLGTAAKADDAEITPYLVSRFYRAPEVILGMPFDYAIDMWSIGCTLFELYTGRILFAGSDNNQMLRAIQECRGKFPIRMLKKSSLADRHFDAEANFISQESDKITGKVTMRPLNFNKSTPGKDLKARLMLNAKDMAPAEIKELQAFIDLMEKCLQLDPVRRITPNDALRHHFIAHTIPAPVEKARTVVPAMTPIPRVK